MGTYKIILERDDSDDESAVSTLVEIEKELRAGKVKGTYTVEALNDAPAPVIPTDERKFSSVTEMIAAFKSVARSSVIALDAMGFPTNSRVFHEWVTLQLIDMGDLLSDDVVDRIKDIDTLEVKIDSLYGAAQDAERAGNELSSEGEEVIRILRDLRKTRKRR